MQWLCKGKEDERRACIFYSTLLAWRGYWVGGRDVSEYVGVVSVSVSVLYFCVAVLARGMGWKIARSRDR